MLSASQLHARLEELFPGGVGPLAEPAADEALEVQIDPSLIHFIAEELKRDASWGVALLTLIDVDPRADGHTLRYRFAGAGGAPVLTLRMELAAGVPFVLTIADVWPNAEWHEMNVEGLSGLHYETHPDCTNSEHCINHNRGTRCLRLTGGPGEFHPQ